MIRNVRKTLTALTALLALLGAARAALATGYEEPVASQRVSYSDLNLDRASDAARLYARLERAAVRVCNADLGPYAQARVALRKCVDYAVANAVARIDHPNLTGLHAAYAGKGTHVTANR